MAIMVTVVGAERIASGEKVSVWALVVAAFAGAGVSWALRFVRNLWFAPHSVAFQEVTELSNSYERLNAAHEAQKQEIQRETILYRALWLPQPKPHDQTLQRPRINIKEARAVFDPHGDELAKHVMHLMRRLWPGERPAPPPFLDIFLNREEEFFRAFQQFIGMSSLDSIDFYAVWWWLKRYDILHGVVAPFANTRRLQGPEAPGANQLNIAGEIERWAQLHGVFAERLATLIKHDSFKDRRGHVLIRQLTSPFTL